MKIYHDDDAKHSNHDILAHQLKGLAKRILVKYCLTKILWSSDVTENILSKMRQE